MLKMETEGERERNGERQAKEMKLNSEVFETFIQINLNGFTILYFRKSIDNAEIVQLVK